MSSEGRVSRHISCLSWRRQEIGPLSGPESSIALGQNVSAGCAPTDRGDADTEPLTGGSLAGRTLVRPNTVGVQWDKLRLSRYNSSDRPARQEQKPLYPEYPPRRRGNDVTAGNGQTITQPSNARTTKVAAGGAAGALTVLVVWILGLLHVLVPPDVASAITA